MRRIQLKIDKIEHEKEVTWAGFGARDHSADCFTVLDVEQEHASHDAIHKSNRGSLAIKEGNGMGRSLY